MKLNSQQSSIRYICVAVLFVTVCLFMTACGGGSGGDDSSDADGTTADSSESRVIEPEVLYQTNNPDVPFVGVLPGRFALAGVDLSNNQSAAVFGAPDGTIMTLISDSNGDPSGAVIGDYRFFFENFNGRTADVIVVMPDGTQERVNGVDVSAALSRNLTAAGPNARILDDVRGFANFVSGGACLVGLGALGLSSGGTAIPVLAPLATIIGCSNFVLQNTLPQSADGATASDEGFAVISTLAGSAACATGDFGGCVGAAADGADLLAEGAQNVIASFEPAPEEEMNEESEESSDETELFSCDDGGEIPVDKVCNTTMDCADGSDEESVLCETQVSCCEATLGCPSETGSSCGDTCCCCPFGEACGAEIGQGCVPSARLAPGAGEESALSKLIFKGSYF